MSILIYFAAIFWSLFPNLIHVFQGGEDFINKVNETNLVSNGDFSLDTNNDNIPDGFRYVTATDITLNDGISTFTPTALYGRLVYDIVGNTSDDIYIYSSYKTDSVFVRLAIPDISTTSLHSGSNNFEYVSAIYTLATSRQLQITDVRSSNWTPISVDYIGAYNVSTMINKGVKDDNGIPFSDLTNEEIKTQLDTWISEHGDLSFTITKDNTFDSWFNTGFVDKQAERDFLDYLGYFVWLMTPPVILFITLDVVRRLI